jgi:hypothetical protein
MKQDRNRNHATARAAFAAAVLVSGFADKFSATIVEQLKTQLEDVVLAENFSSPATYSLLSFITVQVAIQRDSGAGTELLNDVQLVMFPHIHFLRRAESSRDFHKVFTSIQETLIQLANTQEPDLELQCSRLKQEVDALRRRVSELEAARIAYASEFPLTADGEPDVGNIHANIRKLKAAAQAQPA